MNVHALARQLSTIGFQTSTSFINMRCCHGEGALGGTSATKCAAGSDTEHHAECINGQALLFPGNCSQAYTRQISSAVKIMKITNVDVFIRMRIPPFPNGSGNDTFTSIGSKRAEPSSRCAMHEMEGSIDCQLALCQHWHRREKSMRKELIRNFNLQTSLS
jgi:hypothetical protein